MNPDELRGALAATHHEGRILTLLDLGARGDASLAALRDGDVFDRRNAALANQSLRRGDLALRDLADPSATVRSLAMQVVPQACDDAQCLEALQMAWSMRQDVPLLQRMASRRREAPVDAYLDWLAAQTGVTTFADVIAYGSRAAIARHLDRALARPSSLFYDRMARRAPEVLAGVFAAALDAVPGEPDPVTRRRIDTHLLDLAQRGPDAALPVVARLVARGIIAAAAVWRALMVQRPEPTLDLLEAHPAVRVAWTVPSHLAARFTPDALGRLARREIAALGDLHHLLRAITDAQRAALVRAWVATVDRNAYAGTALFAHLDADAPRDALYAAWSLATRDAQGVIPLRVVERLPADLAAREGRRHLAEVVSLQTKLAERIPYARFLPWDEAESALKSSLGHPEGDVRGLALGNLLAIPGRWTGDLTLPARALALVMQRKNEQDPVRRAAIFALTQWPRACWRAEHRDAVAQIVRDALDAADLSDATARLVESLVVRTFRLDPAWGARLLSTVIKERGTLYDPRLGEHLDDADLTAAAPHLMEILRTWAKQERDPWIEVLVRSLGDRALRLDGLSALIEQVRDDNRHAWRAVPLTVLFAELDRSRYERSLGATLRGWQKRGWYGQISALAAAEATNDAMHGPRPERPSRSMREVPTMSRAGALSTRGDRAHRELVEAAARVALLPIHIGEVANALSALRQASFSTFDRTVEKLLRDDPSAILLGPAIAHVHRRRQDLLDPFLGERVMEGRLATGKTRWLLPFVRGFDRWNAAQHRVFEATLAGVVAERDRDTPTILAAITRMPGLLWTDARPLAALADDDRPVVQERALRVMSRCDAGQCVPTLLRALDDARARIAIYGLRRAVMRMPPSVAVSVLVDVPMKKVTVAKEAVRLLGAIRSVVGYQRLLMLDETELHRDVRIALLRALWDHLDREPTWAVFSRAVEGPDPIMASRLGDIPAERLTEATDARLSALLARVVARPEPDARIALLQRAAALSVRDRGRVFLTACGARLRSPYDDEVRAAMMAVLQRADETDVTRLHGLFTALRDDVRALHRALEVLVAQPVRARRVYRLAARAAELALTGDPTLCAWRVRCAGASLEPDEFAQWVVALAESSPLDHDAMEAARAVIFATPRERLEGCVTAWSSAASVDARRMAVWAVEADPDGHRGWTDLRRAQLAALRADRAPAVAGAARRVFPPRELDPT